MNFSEDHSQPPADSVWPHQVDPAPQAPLPNPKITSPSDAVAANASHVHAEDVQADSVAAVASGLRSSAADQADSAAHATMRPAAKSQSRRKPENGIWHLAMSTLLSLSMVVALLMLARFTVPALVENVRYGWYRGQLRAQYELSGQRLKNVSLDSLADVSQLVSSRVGPSVVHINLMRNEDSLTELEKLLLRGRDASDLLREGQGSGFVIDPDGHILTNHHVVASSERLQVTLSDGRKLDARVVGSDPPTDLAVLKVDAKRLLPIEWGNSDDVVVGTPVWAVGSPFGLQQTVTFGIISGKHRVDFRGTNATESFKGNSNFGDLMQSDVALNPGNSGGPLVDSLGQVVGVNAAILGERYQGISFSIPSRVAQRVAQSLILRGEVARGWLGISMVDLPEKQRYSTDGSLLPGVLIKGFPRENSSPARDAGLMIDDIIVVFQGQAVPNQARLMQLIGETEVGTKVAVEVLRDGVSRTFQVTIDQRPSGL